MNDLCIGGGGYSGLSFIGCLEYLDKNNLLELKNFHGTSIGSLIGVAYLLGIKPISMLNHILKLNFQDIAKYDFKHLESFHIIDDKLLDNLINLLNINENVSQLSIKQISDKTGININVYATNVTTNTYTSFNNRETPDVKIIDAIKASMSIPFLFKPVEINNNLYIDGCCKNIYGLPPEDIYVCGYTIVLKGSESSYVNDVIKTMLNRPKPRTTFLIKCDRIAPMSTYLNLKSLESNLLIEMYKHGIDAARKYCN
jgi:NTE family protein